MEKYEKDIEWLLKRYPSATEKQQDIFAEKCGIIQDHLQNVSDEEIRNNVLEIMIANEQL